jgi:hypothetical protein
LAEHSRETHKIELQRKLREGTAQAVPFSFGRARHRAERSQLSQIRRKRKIMTNILKKLGVGIVDFGKWFAGAAQDTVSLAAKIETILKAAEPLEAPFVTGPASVVSDVEALITGSTAAVSANGLNFPADSKAYQEFLTLVTDFRKLAPLVTEAIHLLEGKAPKPPSTALKN